MKLQNELEHVVKTFEAKKDAILEHKAFLIKEQSYKNLEVRLAWDCLRAFVGTAYITMLYDKYNAVDNHITTLGVRALKDVGIL